ncbi:MAG TPA: GNAT family N-acetyltransferase [Patescibacteria group bacterium]|nr:GNAT family N-acetyltransferase [Patescibacteria group bacterium]
MKTQPTLYTERLILRPMTLDDAPRIKELAGAREIAETTANIPHPYEDGMAEEFIRPHAENYAAGTQAVFAITLRETGELIGAVGLMIKPQDENAEMGYWLGKEYWNRGYVTEAAREVIKFGFKELNLHRIHAHYFSRNIASGKIMQKIGMKHEGHSRDALKKWGKFESIDRYAIVKDDFLQSEAAGE